MTEDFNQVYNYWDAAKAVIDAAGDYAAIIKLRANYLDSSTRNSVEHVVEKYYGNGGNGRLEKAIESCYYDFFAKVEKLNILCRQYNVMQITKPDKLLNLLLDPRRRRSYRGKMERKRRKGEICPLQVFEK